MATYSKTELESFSIINDKISPYFQKLARNQSVFQKYKNEIARIMDKNSGTGRGDDPSNVLQTYIVGRQLLINKEDIKKCKDILGYDEKELEDAYNSSPYFQQFKEMARKEVFLYTFPLIIYSAELYKAGKKSESFFVYFSAFLREYASRVSVGWPHGVNDGRMRYTVEELLDGRYDIKKYGTVYAVLYKKAESSYLNYIERMENNMTDKLLYDIQSSGISTMIRAFLVSINEKYRQAEGKYLNFELNSAISSDEDTEGSSFNLEIKSNSAVKKNIVNKALLKCNTTKVDDTCVRIATKSIYKTTSSNSSYYELLKITIKQIIDDKRSTFPDFFDAILSYFLYTPDKKTGKQNVETDIKSAKFIMISDEIFKASNTKNPSILKVKTLLKEYLRDCSYEYNTWTSNDYKNKLEKAVLKYFVLILRFSA